MGDPFSRLGRVCAWLAIAIGMATPSGAEENPASTLIFGSLDASPSVFATAGMKLAFDRIDREGFTLLASAGAGARFERGPTTAGGAPTRATRVTGLGAALFGYQWFRDWGVVAVHAGPEGSVERLSCRCGASPLPILIGLRLHGEVWARPSETTLVNATLTVGSARGDLWARVAYGDRIAGVYLGPEIALYGDGTGYRKLSFGFHATDLAWGEVRFRLSGGYLIKTETARAGLYLGLAAWTPW